MPAKERAEPIELATMPFDKRQAYFEDATRALQTASGLSTEAIELCFDIKFQMDFETAPRSMRTYWKKGLTTWERVIKALDKTETEFAKLSQSSRIFYQPELEKLHATRQSMQSALDDERKLSDSIPNRKGNGQALVLAMAVAAAFQHDERDITFGRVSDSTEPSTEFGRAVRTAIQHFKPEGNSGQVADWNAPTKAAWELVKSGHKK